MKRKHPVLKFPDENCGDYKHEVKSKQHDIVCNNINKLSKRERFGKIMNGMTNEQIEGEIKRLQDMKKPVAPMESDSLGSLLNLSAIKPDAEQVDRLYEDQVQNLKRGDPRNHGGQPEQAKVGDLLYIKTKTLYKLESVIKNEFQIPVAGLFTNPAGNFVVYGINDHEFQKPC